MPTGPSPAVEEEEEDALEPLPVSWCGLMITVNTMGNIMARIRRTRPVVTPATIHRRCLYQGLGAVGRAVYMSVPCAYCSASTLSAGAKSGDELFGVLSVVD